MDPIKNNLNEGTPPSSPTSRQSRIFTCTVPVSDIIQEVGKQTSPKGKHPITSPESPREYKRLKTEHEINVYTSPERQSRSLKRPFPFPTPSSEKKSRRTLFTDDNSSSSSNSPYSLSETLEDLFSSINVSTSSISYTYLSLTEKLPKDMGKPVQVNRGGESDETESFKIFSDENASSTTPIHTNLEAFISVPKKEPITLNKYFEARLKQITVGYNCIKVGNTLLTIGEQLGQGSLLVSFKIEERPRVLKLFNSKAHKLINEEFINHFILTMIANYNAATILSIPIAKIDNLSTIEKDYCILQEYIARPFSVYKEAHVQAAKMYLTLIFAQEVIMDIQPENLRVDANDKPVLISFSNPGYEDFDQFVKYIVRQWATCFANQRGNPQLRRTEQETAKFLKTFTQGFEEYGYDLRDNDTILKQLFPKVTTKKLNNLRV